jgi:hypothetical protein
VLQPDGKYYRLRVADDINNLEGAVSHFLQRHFGNEYQKFEVFFSAYTWGVVYQIYNNAADGKKFGFADSVFHALDNLGAET